MKLKIKLLICNIVIVLFSLLTVFGFIAYIGNNIIENLYTTEAVSIDENLDVVKEFMLNSGYDEIKENINSYNYTLFVYENKNQIYGDYNNDLKLIIENSSFEDDEIKEIFVSNKSGILKVANGKIYIALENKDVDDILKDNVNTSSLVNEFKKLVIFSIISLIAIVLLFSYFIIKNIMKPINQLSKGANRIEDGNYDEPILYEKNDEFKKLINNFNSMQDSLKSEKEKNIKYEKAKKEMIKGISHDVRTPLTAVKGYIKGIQDGIANTPQKQNEYLSTAYNRTLDIENLLDKLFDTFNYETGEIKLNKEKVNIEEYIKEYVEDKKIELKHKNIKIKINKMANKVYAEIDKKEFKRVFDNLINNSIKYANVDDLVIEINTWIQDKTLKISYKDNGKGVKESNLDKLFDEFYKEDDSRTDSKSNGSGLGLFIVKTIIESHEGNIIAKNKDGLYFEISLNKDIEY